MWKLQFHWTISKI